MNIHIVSGPVVMDLQIDEQKFVKGDPLLQELFDTMLRPMLEKFAHGLTSQIGGSLLGGPLAGLFFQQMLDGYKAVATKQLASLDRLEAGEDPGEIIKEYVRVATQDDRLDDGPFGEISNSLFD